MCIYWVKHYSCGHYADYLQPTLLSHCQEFDVVLRYWHDQVCYRPLEAENAEFGTLQMPQPCRPIWPIPFPRDSYLPLPARNSEFPRGLARPRPGDMDIAEALTGEAESLNETLIRENALFDRIGSFRAVAAHQQRQSRLSIAEETKMYQQLYPGTQARSTRVADGQTAHYQPITQPYYPHLFIAAILSFNFSRGLPDQTPNVIIRSHPTGCLRTPNPLCGHDPTNPHGLQCPWLLATRTPWIYPRFAANNRNTITRTGLPYPHLEAQFLADFSTRGGARSKHTEKDPAGSEMTRVALTRNNTVGRIPDIVYLHAQTAVPEGPWRHHFPAGFPVTVPSASSSARNPFAAVQQQQQQ